MLNRSRNVQSITHVIYSYCKRCASHARAAVEPEPIPSVVPPLTDVDAHRSHQQQQSSAQRTHIPRSSLCSIPTSSRLIEKLPSSLRKNAQNAPTTHPDYSPNLSYSQLQYLESGEYDIAVHDGQGNLLLKDQTMLPEFGKYGVQHLSENGIFAWIKQTEHLYRETYRDLMQVDPDLLCTDPEQHLSKFPFEKNAFFEQTGLGRNDIKAWNLLLRVQTYQSHARYLETTADGVMNRNKAFLCVLDTFRDMQALAVAEHEHGHAPPETVQAHVHAPASESHLLVLNIDTYNTMLSAMAYHAEPNMCIDLLREMGAYGINPSQQSYLWLLKAFVQRHQVHEAHDTLNYLKANSECSSHRIELELYNQVLYGYLRARRKTEAIRLFDAMMQIDGEHPNTKTYTIMMDYYRQTMNVNGGVDLLREMEDRGYTPNRKTYNAVILAAAHGDVEDYAFKKMFQLFDEMVVSKEIPPDAHTFAALIVGCGQIGDIETATKCLHLMDKMGVARTKEVYEAFLRAIGATLAKRKNFITIGSTRHLKTNDLIRLGESMVKQMQSDSELALSHAVDINVVNALLSIYTNAQTMNRALLFYKSMPLRFEHVEANRETMKLLWKGCMKSRRYKDAQYVFDLIRARQHDETQPAIGSINSHQYRQMVRLASYYKDEAGVVRYLQMMKDENLNIRGRDRAYLAMIMGSKAEQLEARRRFSHESRQRRKDVTIRQKAKIPNGKHGLSFKKWSRDTRWAAEKAAGLRNKQAPRMVGKIYWNVNRTLGQLDDPW